MKVKEGDILVCLCDDCNLQLVVQRTCTAEGSCECGDGDGCDITVTCCNEPMALKEKKSGCCCGE
jgi:hypothetical protein